MAEGGGSEASAKAAGPTAAGSVAHEGFGSTTSCPQALASGGRVRASIQAQGPFTSSTSRPELLRRVDTLVFAGGGARGVAHAGALAGIKAAYGVDWGLGEPFGRPRLVAGASIGAILAMMVALGASAERVKEEAERTQLEDMLNPPSISNVLENWPCFSDAKRLRQRIADVVGSLLRRSDADRVLLRDSPTPLCVVLADNGKSCPVYAHSRDPVMGLWPLVDVVYASCALPGIFPPFYRGSREFVDGGLCDNLPVIAALRIVYDMPPLTTDMDVIKTVDANPSMADRVLAFDLRASDVVGSLSGHAFARRGAVVKTDDDDDVLASALGYYARSFHTVLVQGSRVQRLFFPPTLHKRVITLPCQRIGILDRRVPDGVRRRVMCDAAARAVTDIEGMERDGPRPSLDEVRLTSVLGSMVVLKLEEQSGR